MDGTKRSEIRGEKGLFTQFESISPKVLMNYEEKKSDFTMEKPGRQHLNQVLKINMTFKKTNQHHEPPGMGH